MDSMPDTVADRTRRQLEEIHARVTFALTADVANRHDPKEWSRAILRELSSIHEKSKDAEKELSDWVDDERLLTPTELSIAANVSTPTLYKRRERREAQR